MVSKISDVAVEIVVGLDGSATLQEAGRTGSLTPYVQPPLPSTPAPTAQLELLRRQHVAFDLDAALGDISACGHVLLSRFMAQPPPPDCSPPTCLVEPVLPAPLPLSSPAQPGAVEGRGAQAPGGQTTSGTSNGCGWVERRVSIAELARLDALGLQRRLAAREAGQDSGWRGFSVTVPYMPGGVPESSLPGAGAKSPAAQEAESGLWLAQLTSGCLPRVAPPGLGAGVWGAWAKDEAQVVAEQEALAAQLAADRAAPPSPLLQYQQLKQQEQPVELKPKAPAPAPAGPTIAVPTLPAPSLTAEPGSRKDAADRKADAGAAMQGMFDNLWMLGNEGEDKEEEEEESEDEEGPVQPAAAAVRPQENGAVSSVLAGVSLPPQAAAQTGDETADEVLTAADAMVASALQSSRQAASAASRPLLGAKPSSAAAHDWAVRGGIPDVSSAFDQLRPRLALHYPFELDTFQVFVAAHTSAGKTVVAEYAFALATKHCTRAIYTSPIKTISNQKFRDLSAKFEVGLLTGDVQIKPTSPCLIMTTEILRSMLYKGADVIRDVEWVVFDEVHYVNDADRGVVWEEVIIMLPPHVGLVLLSATVPNVMDFADWVGRTKRKVVYVTGTTKRPVPLQHSLYYNNELYNICTREVFTSEGIRAATAAYKKKNEVPETKKDEKNSRPTGKGPTAGPNAGGRGQGGGRGEGGFQRSHGSGGADRARQQVAAYNRGGGPAAAGGGGGGRPGERQQLLELVHLLEKKSMLPVAVFCFSKKRCDAAVDGLASLDLTTAAEKHTIHVFLEKCLARLREGDRQLPQILRLRELVRRGLAVHHAGLLPIMKEVVEMLFCQGYVKVLFCTETFAMGVNAPTRTVVFHSLRKHDGKNFRYLMPGEYTQMAGRAGRRGLDAVGHVLVACWEDIPGETELRTMLTGRGVSLESQFRLTYSMILNLMRVEDLKVEDMMKRSFAEWRAQRAMPQAALALQEIDTQLKRAEARPWPACVAGCTKEEVAEYYELSSRIEKLSESLQATIMGNRSAQSMLVPGRVVLWANPINGLTEAAVVLGDTPQGCTMPDLSAPAKTSGSTSAAGAGSSSLLSSSSSGSAGSSEKRVALLVLHRPGAVDARHLAQLAEHRAASAAAQPAKAPAASMQDEFAGMRIMMRNDPLGSGKGKTRSGGGPGPLPRYGTSGGLPYMMADAPATQIIGLGRAKLKVDSEELLQGAWGPSGEEPQDRGVVGALSAALRALSKEVDNAGGAPDSLPLLDPRSDLKINDMDTLTALATRQSLMTQRAALLPHRCPSLAEQYGVVRTRALLRSKRDELAHKCSDQALLALPEFHQRVEVLQGLNYLDAEKAVTLKGRVLCEINSTQDELLATELVFSGLLSTLSPAEAVALISALVFQEKSDVEPELPPSLSEAHKQLIGLAKETAGIQQAHGLQIDPSEHVAEVLHPGLMQVVYEWALGTPFVDICQLTDVMEGSIVRAVVRLDQACRELQDAARVMGNTSLFQQMQAASAAIKRDVIFAASLYVA